MFYEKLNKVSMVVDSGVYFEIREFFLSQDFISGCEIKIIDSGYDILLKGNVCDKRVYNKMFFSFVSFVQYSHLTCYTSTADDKNIFYELITANEKMNGFYCKVTIE